MRHPKSQEMTSFKPVQKLQKCIWCGRYIETRPLEFDFREGTKNAATIRVQVCNDTCKGSLIENEKKYEGKAPVFIAALVIFLITGACSAILSIRSSLWLYPGVAGMVLFGSTVYCLPFVTPQTVRHVGYRKGQHIGRITGIVLIMAGITLGGFLYLNSVK